MEQRSQILFPEESNSETSRRIEVYKQKYENFRHFDKLRWQAPGIALAIAAGVVAFSAREGTSPRMLSILLLVLGTLTCLCAFTMWRIGAQLEANREILDKAAKLVGDNDIPGRTRFFRSATWYFQLFLWLVGGGSFNGGLILFFKTWW